MKNILYYLLSFLLIAIPIVLFCKYVYYGSLTRNCIYSELKISIPKQLKNCQIVVSQDAYLAIGKDDDYSCLKEIGKIERQVVGPASIKNLTIGKKYYQKRGKKVIPLLKGTSFRLIGIIAVKKHGISTIDSGPGPIYHLVLKGSQNNLYQIATVSLGFNEGDYFLSLLCFPKPSHTTLKNLLTVESFDEVWSKKGKSFVFTGVLK